MRNLLLAFFIAMCLVLITIPTTGAQPYSDNSDDYDISFQGNSIDDASALDGVEKRSCVRRSGNCDHRPNDCCYNSSCRCNLWGSNCRCQRMGLFQKWG